MFLQGFYLIYGHIWRVYTVLAHPTIFSVQPVKATPHCSLRALLRLTRIVYLNRI